MPRAKAILQSDFPYNISARCINREWFQLPMERVWEIFCEELKDVSEKHQLGIHSFVLMSNHFHLIASTPEANISQCMHRFMMRTSRRLTFEGNRINETYAGRHYKCVLSHPNFYLNAYKYNYRNPVAAGICSKVEEYPFSTLQFLTGRQRQTLPLLEDFTYFSGAAQTLEWLNTAPEEKKVESVRQALSRPVFAHKKARNTNMAVMSIHDLL